VDQDVTKDNDDHDDNEDHNHNDDEDNDDEDNDDDNEDEDNDELPTPEDDKNEKVVTTMGSVRMMTQFRMTRRMMNRTKATNHKTKQCWGLRLKLKPLHF
jgi:hypothetical protein